MNRLLAITGATGRKSGGAFFELLCEKSEKIDKAFSGGVRLIVRSSSNTDKITSLHMNTDIVCGDFNDELFLIRALSHVDTLVHIAGIKLSKQLVDAAVTTGVRRVILVHTTGIYSKYKEAGEEYRKIDAYVEKRCRENNILLTILRPTMIYGNISDKNIVEFIKMVDKLPVMPVVNGARYALQPVHYGDLAKAYYQVLMNEEATANTNFVLSGGEELLLRDMLNEIGKNLGKKVRFVSCPFVIAYTGAWGVYLLSLKKIDLREKVQRLCEPRVYSYKEAANAFGYAPRTFRDGIVAEVEEYKLEGCTK